MIVISAALIALTAAGGSIYQDQREKHTPDVNYAYDSEYYNLDD